MSTESRLLGKYELQERLASGGQGEVWKAFDLQLHRFVAIKQLNAHLQDDPDSITRFEREAQFIASLRHPNIVQIHNFLQLEPDAGSNSPTAYIVMDYIEGPTLANYIRNTSRKKQFPSAFDIVSIFTAVSLALDYAHQKGMIHRDIKPANIMLDKRNPNGKPMGDPILMDFGIAKLEGGSVEATKVLGTPLYVSPEQAQGLPSDKRSDLYSLGIVLYEVMTGFPPFHDESALALLRLHREGVPTPPEFVNPHISPNLSAVILKSIAKDPHARFSSASAMTIALAEALNVPASPELWKAAARSTMPPASGASNLSSQPEELTPTFITPSSQSPALASPLAFAPLANGNNPYQIPPVSQSFGKHARKNFYIAAISVLALLVLASASYLLFVPKTPPVSNTIVGQVHFLSSKKAAAKLDEVQITLQSIPDGESYYAWLETHDFSSFLVHWTFTAQNKILSPASYLNPQQQNLLTSRSQPYLFLITKESGTATVPSIDVKDRLYYALIPRTTSALHNYSSADQITLNLLPCPQTDDSANPCIS
jgi:eukaryotic-like serine/threonine-protein kinase